MARAPRRLRVSVVTAQGALPVLVAASVVPADGCAALTEPDDAGAPAGDAGRQGGGSSGAGGSAGAGSGGNAGVGVGGSSASGAGGSGGDAGTAGLTGTGGLGGFGGNPGVGGSAATGGSGTGGVSGEGGAGGGMAHQDTPLGSCDLEVSIPPEGVPAEPGQICAAKVVPVDSNRAARVQLTKTGFSPSPVEGLVEVASELLGMIVGAPTIELLDANDPSLLDFTVDSLVPDPAGFRFTAHFGDGAILGVDGATRVTVRVSLQVMCPDAPQVVHAVTDVHLCGMSLSDSVWVSSGSVCSVCRVIAEMAPSPIVPDRLPDALPLAHVLRLRIVELARVAGSVVLLAEHDGGEGLDYDWRVSDGEVERLAPDVIALSLPVTASAPLVQVAAYGADAAAVASWAFNAEAGA